MLSVELGSPIWDRELECSYAESKTASFEGPQEQTSCARPFDRTVIRRMPKLPWNEAAPPGLPTLRIL